MTLAKAEHSSLSELTQYTLTFVQDVVLDERTHPGLSGERLLDRWRIKISIAMDICCCQENMLAQLDVVI